MFLYKTVGVSKDAFQGRHVAKGLSQCLGVHFERAVILNAFMSTVKYLMLNVNYEKKKNHAINLCGYH